MALPFPETRKAVVLKAAQDTQSLVQLITVWDALQEKEVPVWATPRIERAIALAKRSSDSFHQKEIAATDASLFQVRVPLAVNTDGRQLGVSLRSLHRRCLVSWIVGSRSK